MANTAVNINQGKENRDCAVPSNSLRPIWTAPCCAQMARCLNEAVVRFDRHNARASRLCWSQFHQHEGGFSVQRNVPRHPLRGVCCCDWAILHKGHLDGCSESIALCLKFLAIKPQAKPTITSGFGQPKITEPSTLLEQIAAEKARGAPPMDKAKSFNALLVTEG